MALDVTKNNDNNNNEQQQPQNGEYVTLRVALLNGFDRDKSLVWFKMKKTTKLKKLMDTYCARVDREAGSLVFGFGGDRVVPDSTPYDLEMEDEDEIDAYFHLQGGGWGTGPSVPGPNLDSVLSVEKWDNKATADRTVYKGLNIEFTTYNGQTRERIIGHVPHENDGTLVFNVGIDWRKIYCPSCDVYLQSVSDIVSFYFLQCVVHFEGDTGSSEGANGGIVNEWKTFGIYPSHYNGLAMYSFLKMTVQITDEMESFRNHNVNEGEDDEDMEGDSDYKMDQNHEESD